jgi:hypothetical protein
VPERASEPKGERPKSLGVGASRCGQPRRRHWQCSAVVARGTRSARTRRKQARGVNECDAPGGTARCISRRAWQNAHCARVNENAATRANHSCALRCANALPEMRTLLALIAQLDCAIPAPDQQKFRRITTMLNNTQELSNPGT